MNYSQFLYMMPEVTLVVLLLVTFVADFATSQKIRTLAPTDKRRSWFNPMICLLMFAHILINLFPIETHTVFGGMYIAAPAIGVIKTILAFGTLIVLIQSKEWLSRPDTAFKEGEFYLLVIATLLGMNMMVSANHFLLFFLGLEMASVPMACLVAFDKYRHDSAEAGAKFILTATFSSGVMLYGISFIYGAVGTLYFEDIATQLTATPFTILGMVFFFSGLGFKISLVPFHFWAADSYQGAPTTVTGYLSVVSKGAAAFALCTILMKVFAPMVLYWQYMLYIVIVLSITVANLFAIRQTNLKRFMAFSSISQAGYIVLAIVGNSALSVTALSYNGFYQTNPKLAFLMTLALFSLGGIPPFAGMFSKFFIFMAAVQDADLSTSVGAWAYIVLFIALINTVISLYYYLLIVKAMYIKKSDNPLPTFKSHTNTKLALAVCTAGVVLFGVCYMVFDWIHAASIAL